MSGRSPCLADFPGPALRFREASERYASTPDGGSPGTPAAVAYRAEVRDAYDDAVRRFRTLVVFALLGIVV